MTDFEGHVLVQEAKREARMRRRVYPRWVQQGKMTDGQASSKIAMMDAIADRLAGPDLFADDGRQPDFSKAMNHLPKRGSTAEKDYFGFIGALPCCVSGSYGVQVAHFRSSDPRFHKPITGTGIKNRVPYVLPLSEHRHREQESMNEWTFWASHGFPRDPAHKSPPALCWTLWSLYQAQIDNPFPLRDVACQIIRNWRKVL